MPRRIVAIMAGGRGERFWPHSRRSRPKHFLPIAGGAPLLAQTVRRLEGLVPVEDVLVVTAAAHAGIVAEVCPGLPAANIIGEPVGRDTAAVAALVNLLAARREAGATVVLLPADHVVHDEAGFRSTLVAACEAVEAEPAIATIGIRPAQPETGFGYLECGEELGRRGGHAVHAVRRFVEKPDRATAEGYVASGRHFWNGGMFVWPVAVFAAELRAQAPDIAEAFDGVAADLEAGRPLAEVLAARYPGVRRISLDFAVMEKARRVVMVPAGFDWDDVGAWTAVARHAPADEAGNVTRGRAVIVGGRRNIVLADGGHLVAVLGAEDLVVVHTADATLVCPAARVQDVKQLLARVGELPGGDAHL